MMPETGVHLFFGAAHPQKGVPQVSLQEGLWGSGWQTQEWQRQQQPRGFFQSHPQEGWQGDCHQLPGLECPLSLSDFTTPQWTGDLSPPQVDEG